MIHSLPSLRQQFVRENKQFYEFPTDDPRTLKTLSIAHQKKRAKELLKAWRDARDLELLERYHPKAATLSAETVRLVDAQLVIARQNGFTSWPRLKHHAEMARISKQVLDSGQPSALDADAKTLHIRCGNDVMYKLAIAGFTGDFLSFADPYIQGPVPANIPTDKFIRIRAGFISGNHAERKKQVVSDLTADYAALYSGSDYERIAFWFEHDAYDVLVFIKLLHFYSEHKYRCPDMQYLCVDHYPGVERFNGIGQLPAEAMRVLWSDFQALTDSHFNFGKKCWQAYTHQTPELMAHIVADKQAALPEIIPALKRQLQELPWLIDGLALSERLTLQILNEHGPLNAADLFFNWYTCRYEPLVFMGDSSYWLVLEALSNADKPAISIEKQSDKKIDWIVTLTDFGNSLLSGEGHWMKSNQYDRWWGGTHNQSQKGVWLWDEHGAKVVHRKDFLRK